MAESILSQEEIDTLLNGVPAACEGGDPPPAPCDLGTQERVSRGAMPRLQIINESFSRLLRARMSSFLRRDVSTSTPEMTRTKFTEFTRRLGSPTSLALVRLKPLRGTALVVVDPDLVFLIVDRMFGGEGRVRSHQNGRGLTQTDERIIRRTLDVVFAAYAKAWEPIFPIAPEYVRTETNAQLATIAAPNDVVVETTLNIVLGSFSGELGICMPYAMIEPIRDVLCNVCHAVEAGQDNSWATAISRHLQDAEVELVADLGGAAVTLRDILKMKLGDVIPLSIRNMVAAKVDDVPVLDCTYGTFNGHYALRVERVLTGNTNQPA